MVPRRAKHEVGAPDERLEATLVDAQRLIEPEPVVHPILLHCTHRILHLATGRLLRLQRLLRIGE
jgi:hypothetical protein